MNSRSATMPSAPGGCGVTASRCSIRDVRGGDAGRSSRSCSPFTRTTPRAHLHLWRGAILPWDHPRRKFASDFMDQPLKVLCELRGWKTAQTVLQCYRQADEKQLRTALEHRRRAHSWARLAGREQEPGIGPPDPVSSIGAPGFEPGTSCSLLSAIERFPRAGGHRPPVIANAATRTDPLLREG